MIDITEKGIEHLRLLGGRASPLTRYEEAEYEILRGVWAKHIIHGPFEKRFLELSQIGYLLLAAHPSWDSSATRSLLTKTVETLKELDYIEETE